MKIPISKTILNENEISSVLEPLRSGWLVQGPKVRDFEEKWCKFTKSKYSIAVTSCTTAMTLSLIALGFKEGDEAIVPAFTWISTANVVEQLGGKVVFCDINLDTFNLDLSQIENKITTKTKVILPVHLFGLPVEMDPIIKLSKKYNLKIIEDAACGFGSYYKGKHVGSFGDTGCFSLHPRKSITTGEGGIITTQDDKIAEKIRILRDHGASISDLQRHHGPKPYILSDHTEGNEKVIRPRLADAEFFFNTDKKHSLASRITSLQSILFQKQLGTLAEKAHRIEQIAAHIAQAIGANSEHAARAGLLAKTDLMTEMVMEFPDVQGVMGKYYALHDGEPESVAQAIAEQYMPRQSGDSLPSSDVSSAVALADKLDTLAGIFGIGMLPKGDKDPFALRRAAIGVLRIITERGYDLDVRDLLKIAVDAYGDKLTNTDTLDNATDFVLARFRAMYQDRGIETDVIQAVSARNVSKPTDFAARVHAVASFKALPQALALAAANKRVANILAKNNISHTIDVNETLLNETQERELFEQITQQQTTVSAALTTNNYTTVLSSLATLQPAVDAFFDNIMVMSDDNALRQNRLALLLQLRQLFLTTADISVLTN